MQALYPQHLQGQPATPAKFFSFKNGCQELPDRLTKALQRTRIHLQTTTPNNHDILILAVPAQAASQVLNQPLNFPTTTTTVVTLGFPEPLEQQGTGFLVPQNEPGPVRAATYSSNKWANRAPENHSLIRVFLKDPTSDPVHLALQALKKTNPDFVQVTQHTQPLYTLGHLDRINALKHHHLIGASYGGVGILDCVRQGYETAVKIAGAQ